MVNANARNYGLRTLWEHARTRAELQYPRTQDGVMGDVRFCVRSWGLHIVYPSSRNTILCDLCTSGLWLFLQLCI